MKISGFTIIKNAVINDYPVVEAITSILPVVDEMIVLVGDCKDETEALIRNIPSDKIRIHHSVWNASLRSNGAALADETNKAFALVDPAADWAFYIQGDEVVHENDHAAILQACHAHKNDDRVEGLLFKYLHFYGTYDYVGDSRRWYNQEVRVIRNNKNIVSFRDAQGFRINGKERLLVKPANATVYHYGWVKSPEQMKRKQMEAGRYWASDDLLKQEAQVSDHFDFSSFDSLQKFKGSHPSVMLKRIQDQNWQVEIDVTQKKFTLKEKLLYWFEKQTGIRLFNFRNYKLIP